MGAVLYRLCGSKWGRNLDGMGLGGMGSAYPTVGFPSHFHPIPYQMVFPSHLFPCKPLEKYSSLGGRFHVKAMGLAHHV